MLRFVLKVGVLGAMALYLLPLAPTGEGTDADSVSVFQAFQFVNGVAQDAGGLCERRPDVCESGTALVTSLGVRAREGARIAFEYLDERFGGAVATHDSGTSATRPSMN